MSLSSPAGDDVEMSAAPTAPAAAAATAAALPAAAADGESTARRATYLAMRTIAQRLICIPLLLCSVSASCEAGSLVGACPDMRGLCFDSAPRLCCNLCGARLPTASGNKIKQMNWSEGKAHYDCVRDLRAGAVFPLRSDRFYSLVPGRELLAANAAARAAQRGKSKQRKGRQEARAEARLRSNMDSPLWLRLLCSFLPPDAAASERRGQSASASSLPAATPSPPAIRKRRARSPSPSGMSKPTRSRTTSPSVALPAAAA